jgi:general secretion pathway protein A
MYLAFYGLREKPFNATPDPRFLYMTPEHQEALAQLVYSVQDNRGFLVLTGEVGTGKTTLLHALLQRLDATTAAAKVFDSTLPFDGILEGMLRDFDLPTDGLSRVQQLRALDRFLRERRSAGLSSVLIVDEAQNLSPETLEQVRLLSNFETPSQKLLQILLVGQPELWVKLQLPSLRQLRQRVELFCKTPALSPEQTNEYIRTRLRVAAARDVALFAPPAVARIAEYSGGIPRLINILCDHCLVMGYADQKRRIDVAIVRQAIAYLDQGARAVRAPRRPVRRRRLMGRWLALSALAAAIAGGVAILPWLPEGQQVLDAARVALHMLIR